MSRVNITVPDDLYGRARAAGLNISALTREAIADELRRQEKITALDAYLADLDAELGPVTDEERTAAEGWADRVLGPHGPSRKTA